MAESRLAKDIMRGARTSDPPTGLLPEAWPAKKRPPFRAPFDFALDWRTHRLCTSRSVRNEYVKPQTSKWEMYIRFRVELMEVRLRRAELIEGPMVIDGLGTSNRLALRSRNSSAKFTAPAPSRKPPSIQRHLGLLV